MPNHSPSPSFPSSSAHRPTLWNRYHRGECITFRKTNEPYGALSNLCGGYPLRLHGVTVLTSEALYQSCRFPHLPHLQTEIVSNRSPMGAKMKAKHYRDHTRPDWDDVRVTIMDWCLRVKVFQHRSLDTLLESTGTKDIVEDSHNDRFWGAVPEATGGALVGENVLGRLWMNLRREIAEGALSWNRPLLPPPVDGFLFVGGLVGEVTGAWRLAASSAPARRGEPQAGGQLHPGALAAAL
jgi:ribA/ribD-fused uncharacterized protein